MQDLERLLTAPSGVVPRRAVLLETGSIGDRVDRPDLPESDILTGLCDALRSVRGLPASQPRDTVELLRSAAGGAGAASPDAWRALYDDIKTRDIRPGAVAQFFADTPSAPAALAAAVVDARDPTHLVQAAAVLAVLLPQAPAEARDECGRAIGARLPRLVEAYAAQGSFMRRELKDLTLAALADLLALGGVSELDATAALRQTVRARQDELVRLFVRTPLVVDEDLVRALLDRARKAAPRDRCALFSLLARVLPKLPRVPRDVCEALADVVHSTLAACVRPGGTLNARLALVAGVLVQHAAPVSPLTVTLARALSAASSELVTGALAAAEASMRETAS